jgi:recombination protein RecT
MNPTTVATRAQQGVAKKSPSLETIINSPAFQNKLTAYASLINPAIFVSVLTNQFRKNPKLKLCSQESVFDAIVTCAQLGILPNGRDAHLIPYKDQCQLIIDYKGLAVLAFRNADLVEPIFADVVCENDTFDYNMGRVVRHSWNLRTERGNVIGAYAVAKFKTGGERHDVLSLNELHKARKASRTGDSGPWSAWYEEMCKKTAVRRLCKYLPLSPETVDALEAEDQMNTIDVKPATVRMPEVVAGQDEEPEQLGSGDPDPQSSEQPQTTTAEAKAAPKQEPKETKATAKQEPRKEPEQGGLLD